MLVVSRFFGDQQLMSAAYPTSPTLRGNKLSRQTLFMNERNNLLRSCQFEIAQMIFHWDLWDRLRNSRVIYGSASISFNKKLGIRFAYEGRSESSNNCLIIYIIFIENQNETYLF